MTIYPALRNEDVINAIISAKEITPADIDTARAMSLEDFIGYKNLTINYYPEDFLILLPPEAEKLLLSGSSIGLHQAGQIGWYSSRKHNSNISILTESGGVKFKNLSVLNPALRICSFDLLRDGGILKRRNNILAGGFGLCYHCFREDYDRFFAKIAVSADRWTLPFENFSQKDDSFILFQLKMFAGGSRKELQQLRSENPVFKILENICETAANYFISEHYDVGKFIEKLISELKNSEGADAVASSFSELLEKYINRGIPWEPAESFTTILKEFIDIAATGTENLRSFLDEKPTNRKAVVFLLGMMHTASRLEDQFGFDNFVELLPAVFSTALLSVVNIESGIEFYFNPDQAKAGRADRYGIACDYIAGIRAINGALPRINGIMDMALTMSSFAEIRETISGFQKELPLNRETAEKLKAENNSLVSEISKLKNRNKEMSKQARELEQNYKELILDFEKIQVRFESFRRENAILKSSGALSDIALEKPKDPEHSPTGEAKKNVGPGLLQQYEEIVELEDRKRDYETIRSIKPGFVKTDKDKSALRPKGGKGRSSGKCGGSRFPENPLNFNAGTKWAADESNNIHNEEENKN